MNKPHPDSRSSSARSAQPESLARPISRRSLLKGVVGIAALGGGVAFWRYQQSQTPVYTSTAAQDERIVALAWSPDGKRIASGIITSHDSTTTASIHIWDALTGQHAVLYHVPSPQISSLAWSPNGRLLASASYDFLTTHILSATTGTLLLTYPQDALHAQFAQRAVAWSPDSKRLASAGTQRNDFKYSLQSWDALTGSQVMTYDRGVQSLDLWGVAWSPNGRYLAVTGEVLSPDNGSDNVLQVWDAFTGTSVFLTRLPYGYPLAPSWAPDSQRLVIGGLDDWIVQVWDISKRKVLFTYGGHSGYVLSVAWSPDGKHIASGSEDKSVQIWNAETGERTFSYFGHRSTVWSVSWSPESRYIASCSVDKTIQVWIPQ